MSKDKADMNETFKENASKKNLEEYAKKEKAKQQKSKVLGQKPIKGKTNKKENII